jgi:WD40 repeat protein
VQLAIIIISISFVTLAGHAACAEALYAKPVLVADPGMHTAVIRSVAVDKAGQVAVTGSEDKTVRIWSLADGKLLQTIRTPLGPGFIGQVFAVAMSPDGNLVTIGGWMRGKDEDESVYLFDRSTSLIRELIVDLPDAVTKLAFSSDGRYLAAAIRSGELRVYDRERNWSEVLRDIYSENGEAASIYGITFATDGRLATASFDHKIRLYSPDFKLVTPPKVVTSADQPFQIAFSPDGNVLALGYADAAAIDFLDGHTLRLLEGPNTRGLNYGLPQVAWSRDGQTLFAGGKADVFAWGKAGHGERRLLKVGSDLIEDLIASSDGCILIGTADPLLKCIEGDSDRTRWAHEIALANSGTLAVSKDGTTVDFGYQGSSRLRFDVRSLKLTDNLLADRLVFQPKLEGLLIESWKNGLSPTIGDQLIHLEEGESSKTLAITPDGSGFVLGTSWSLHAFNANNKSLWTKSLGAVRNVNITRDGRLVVAAYDDGAIRWHQMDDGTELLALMVLPGREWVAWTPEGFYHATDGAMAVLHWHTNHEGEAGTTVPVTNDPQLRRPDVLASVLDQPASNDPDKAPESNRPPLLQSGAQYWPHE